MQAVSKVAKVREADRFLVFESIWPHEAGQPLFVWRDGELVARLKVTDPVRRREPNFWVANILSGAPEAGDLVYDELNLPKATPRPKTPPVETGLEPTAEPDGKQDPKTFFGNAQ